jgi:hypothetical protein
MRLPLKRSACLLLLAFLAAGNTLHAKDIDLTQYPLRIHIFNRTEHTFYHHHLQEESRGDGRANLFENGEVHAVDFAFDCGQRILANPGWETYPAKWKKPGKELIVLMPVMGKINTFSSCSFDTVLKTDVYYRHNGGLETESPEDAKAWMVAHGYDPEHDREVPANP